jgi:hypothetical protein
MGRIDLKPARLARLPASHCRCDGHAVVVLQVSQREFPPDAFSDALLVHSKQTSSDKK